MKLRNKLTNEECSSGEFNIHSICEIIVYYKDDCESDFASNYDVLLPNGEYKDLLQAIRDHDVIIDNYNTRFFFPSNDEDRKRGYTLY